MTVNTLSSAILLAKDHKTISECIPVIKELRPHLQETITMEKILRQLKEGYILAYMKEEEEVASCMGFRVFETLGWGKILYIDDLITREKSRKKGFGKTLLDYAVDKAKSEKCDEVHLDSGHHRFDAHRLYLNYGFKLSCHHLSLVLN